MSNTDIDSLLDGTLDDLADLPAFKVFPEGAYTCAISIVPKKIGDISGVELKAKLETVEELADPAATDVPAPGDETSVFYNLANEFAQGAFKEILKSLRSDMNLDASLSNREVMEQANGVSALVVFKVRADKNDPTKLYQGIKKVAII